MGIKELFLKRIYAELTNFKKEMLKLSKKAIYKESYKIEIYVNLYEILKEQAEYMSEGSLWRLILQPSGILGSLYELWLKEEDSFVQELTDFIKEEVCSLEIEREAS